MTRFHCTRSWRALAAALALLAAAPLAASPATDLAQARALDDLPPAQAEARIHALLLDWLHHDPSDALRAWVSTKLDWKPVHVRPLADGRGRLSVPVYPVAATAAAVLSHWDTVQAANALNAAPAPQLKAAQPAAVVAWLQQAPAARFADTSDVLLADAANQPEAVLIALARRRSDAAALSAVARYGRSAAALELLRAAARNGGADDAVFEAALANPHLRAGTWPMIADQLAATRPAWRERLIDAATGEAAAAVALRSLADGPAILGAWLQAPDARRQRAALLAAARLPTEQRKALLADFLRNPDADPALLQEVSQW